MSLENTNAQLAEWVSQNSAKVDKPVEVPAEATQDIVQPTNESVKPVAQETPKEQPRSDEKSQDSLPPLDEKSKTPELSLSWDADETPTTQEPQKFDFRKLGSALELEDADEEKIVGKVSELKSKLKQLEEDSLSGIPDDFKEAIKVTRSGADWKDYLASQLIDYSKIDPIQLFEDEFFREASRDPKYFTDGKFDVAKAEEELDSLPAINKNFMGKQIASQKINEQRQRQYDIQARAEAKAAQAQQALTTAAKNLNELLPLENFGIKFEPKHSTEIYKGIADSSLTKELLGGISYQDLVKSGADMKAVVKTIALAKYAQKMLQYKSQNTKVEAKKELLNQIQNPQIRSTGTAVQPESEGKKPLTPEQLLEQHFSKMRKGL